jgi:hypothetical protein
MRKEIIIAIGIGFILGLIITFGIYRANRALKQQKTPNNNLPTNGNPSSPLPSPLVFLEIIEPENHSVVNKSKITVSGKTDPKASVVFLSEDDEDLVLADEEGVFSGEVPLVSGANEIKIISLSKSGEKQEKILSIVYTTAKIE